MRYSIAGRKAKTADLDALQKAQEMDAMGVVGDNIRTLATVQLSEVLETSRYESTTDEHSHQWMDEKGWECRTAYLQDMSGNIYEAVLNIANGRDRRILYDVNMVRRIDKKRTPGGDVPSTAEAEGARTHHRVLSEPSVADGGQKVKYSIAGRQGNSI